MSTIAYFQIRHNLQHQYLLSLNVFFWTPFLFFFLRFFCSSRRFLSFSTVESSITFHLVSKFTALSCLFSGCYESWLPCKRIISHYNNFDNVYTVRSTNKYWSQKECRNHLRPRNSWSFCFKVVEKTGKCCPVKALKKFFLILFLRNN